MFTRHQLWMASVVALAMVELAAQATGSSSTQQEQSPAKPASETVKTADVVGDWVGTLSLGAIKLRIVFHIINGPGGLKATTDSPDQGAFGLPASSVQVNGSSLRLESAKPLAVFEGTISQDLLSVNGTWKQGGASVPLLLKRVREASDLQRHPRPQEPSKPYPYREEDVVYDNKVGGNRLAATLTIPAGKGPFPSVVLITGSGPQDRDETAFDHKPFLVLADYLTRKGIAVLRADDRGIGKSTGNFATATTADFATDTEAGVAYLKTWPEIDHNQIGLIGHSEGGTIAPMVAARNRDVAFIVMMAGSGVPGRELLPAQIELLTEAAGVSHENSVKAGAEEREVLSMVEHSPDDASLAQELRVKFSGALPEAKISETVRMRTSPWFRYFLSYDPADALRKVTCPVLALNGEKDLQVPPKQNLPAIRKALEAGGNKNSETDELPGLNHLFQTAKTGSPKEYGEIEETMSPLALDKISGWILKRGVHTAAN